MLRLRSYSVSMDAATASIKLLNEKFGHVLGEINIHDQLKFTWMTPWKFDIILNTSRNIMDEGSFYFQYHDSLPHIKNKCITGKNWLNPEWIPNLIDQLEKDPKKLETKPREVCDLEHSLSVALCVEQKLDVSFELSSHIFGAWYLSRTKIMLNFYITEIANNPFNIPLVIENRISENNNPSKFDTIYWVYDDVIWIHKQSVEDIIKFISDKMDQLTI